VYKAIGEQLQSQEQEPAIPVEVTIIMPMRLKRSLKYSPKFRTRLPPVQGDQQGQQAASRSAPCTAMASDRAAKDVNPLMGTTGILNRQTPLISNPITATTARSARPRSGKHAAATENRFASRANRGETQIRSMVGWVNVISFLLTNTPAEQGYPSAGRERRLLHSMVVNIF
jgi:hypothetical protein